MMNETDVEKAFTSIESTLRSHNEALRDVARILENQTVVSTVHQNVISELFDRVAKLEEKLALAEDPS